MEGLCLLPATPDGNMIAHSGTELGDRLSLYRPTTGSGSASMDWVLMAHALLAGQVLLICAVLLVPQNFLKLHSHHFYLVHYLLFWPFFFTSRDRCAFLFSPSFLIISYVCISFVIGGFAFAHGYVLMPKDLADFHRWNHFNTATAFFMSCNLCAALAYFLARRGRGGASLYRAGGSLRAYAPQLVVGSILLSAFSFLSVGASFLGGSGSFSIYPRTFGALVVGIVLVKAKGRYRFLVYLGILLLSAAAQFMDRRVVILLAVSFVFLEASHLRELRPSLRSVVFCCLVLAALVTLQVTMTVARGMLGFKGSYWQTFSKVDAFVKVNDAISYALKQTEGPTTFFHSNNAVHFILKDNTLLCQGSTLAKFLFIAVPRSSWPNKPENASILYTGLWSSWWRARGCCTGINLYAEYFWNFHVLGVICALPILYCFNRIFFFILSALRADRVWPFLYIVVGYNSLLLYARGHGLEGLAIPVIIAFAIQQAFFRPLVSILAAPGRFYVGEGGTAV
jgi:hypothetical protein